MSAPSDKAVEAMLTAADNATADAFPLEDPRFTAAANALLQNGGELRVPSLRAALAAAHDPALGLERSVCVRDAVRLCHETWAEWRAGIGGGMIPFDDIYFKALSIGKTPAEAQALGVDALLEAFLKRLTERLTEANRD